MPKQPLIPRSRTNPVGQTRRIKRVSGAMKRDIRRLERRLIDMWLNMPVSVQNGRLLNRQFYEYLISLDALQGIVVEIANALENAGRTEMGAAVQQAYREGRAKSVENLLSITDDYGRSVTEVLASEPVLRRATLAASRAFEDMKGFSGQNGADLSRILFNAIESGTNPRVVARELRRRFGITRRRADRIARTEITTALRRGYRDEVRDANERFGLDTRIIHYSALIPGRTRATHAARHGRVFTVDEQDEWYSMDGNSINCLCSQSSVVVDENGDPITGKALLDKLAAQRKAFISRGAGKM